MRPSGPCGSRSSVALLLCAGLSARALPDVNLRLVVWDGDDGLRVIRQAVQGFEASHPGIRVKLENVPYGNYSAKLLAQVAANATPDVVMMEPKAYQRFARRGLLAPLDTFARSTRGFSLDAYYKPIADAFRFDGNLYVLPRDIAPIGLIYYNKRLFREAGLRDPDGTWTWDWDPRPWLKEKDFTWVMERLTKFDGQGRPVQWGFVPAWTKAFTDTLVYSQGARYTDDPAGPRRWTWDDPRVVKAYQWVADLGLKRHWIPVSTEISSVLQSSSDQLFLQQKAAMFQCGIWSVPSFRKVLVPGKPEWFDWDITLAPGHVDPLTGKVLRAAPTGGSGYGITSASRHPWEAWLLTTWMAGPPAMRLMAEAGLAQPAIRSLALQQPWIPGPGTPAEQRYPPSRIYTDTAVQWAVVDPTYEGFTEVNSFLESKVDSVMSGATTAEAAFKTGNAEANARLDQLDRVERLPLFDWWKGLAFGALVLGGLGAWVFWPGQRLDGRRTDRAQTRAAVGFLAPWVVGTLALTLGPMALSLLMSTADWDIVRPAHWRGAGNFSEAFQQDARFWNGLEVSTLYTVFSVPLGLVVSLGMALLLNARVRGLAFFRTCFYLPALASTVAASLVFKRIFQAEGGLLNVVIYGPDGHGNLLGLGTALSTVTGKPGPANWLGDERLALPALVLMSLWSAGGGMVILLAGLQGIPQQYYEAATLDGAGPWRRFGAVTLPLLTPALFFCLVTGVIASFQTFTQAFVMTTGGPGDSTRFYILHLYNQAFENLRMGYASALAWILFLVILVFTAAQWRLHRYVHYEGGRS